MRKGGKKETQMENKTITILKDKRELREEEGWRSKGQIKEENHTHREEEEER